MTIRNRISAVSFCASCSGGCDQTFRTPQVHSSELHLTAITPILKATTDAWPLLDIRRLGLGFWHRRLVCKARRYACEIANSRETPKEVSFPYLDFPLSSAPARICRPRARNSCSGMLAPRSAFAAPASGRSTERPSSPAAAPSTWSRLLT